MLNQFIATRLFNAQKDPMECLRAIELLETKTYACPEKNQIIHMLITSGAKFPEGEERFNQLYRADRTVYQHLTKIQEYMPSWPAVIKRLLNIGTVLDVATIITYIPEMCKIHGPSILLELLRSSTDDRNEVGEKLVASCDDETIQKMLNSVRCIERGAEPIVRAIFNHPGYRNNAHFEKFASTYNIQTPQLTEVEMLRRQVADMQKQLAAISSAVQL